ncbi:ABC transporter ATP-binding protein [Pyrofollis japonicus]|uniref:ABC transporter ATP-binding protein n=1 Tax=Pyrofollis japonicus TaxID=3060460 RepID=UPI00295B4764|nr:ABC transporter ATP-binding protein [Pyrofollis japonicus]BEP17906.1 ABC transporter ATP-binding protein [Pyrofollis japonicus]
MKAIRFINVWKIYRSPGGAEYTALRGITFEIEKGDLVSLLGPSGSGKTTVIYLAGGIELPTKGRVEVNGTDLTGMSEAARAKWRRRNVGIVFQFYHLVPTLTVLENVLLPMELAKWGDREERLERAKMLLELVGMWDKREKYPSQLSGGEQQRVAIARALAANPPIILADEPTASLDTENKLKIISLLVEANKLGKTVMYSTHDPSLASRARRIIKIRDGVLE